MKLLLLKKLRLLFVFYKSYLPVSFVITSISLFFFLQYGYSIFNVLFWFKLATLAITYYYINDYKKKEYYYYHNLGLGKWQLWSITLCFDFFLFLFMINQTYRFK